MLSSRVRNDCDDRNSPIWLDNVSLVNGEPGKVGASRVHHEDPVIAVRLYCTDSLCIHCHGIPITVIFMTTPQEKAAQSAFQP